MTGPETEIFILRSFPAMKHLVEEDYDLSPVKHLVEENYDFSSVNQHCIALSPVSF
jgi:hypothetical protein